MLSLGILNMIIKIIKITRDIGGREYLRSGVL